MSSQNSLRDEYLTELLAKLHDPIHKRLIQAYRNDNTVQSMESELGEILLEVLRHED